MDESYILESGWKVVRVFKKEFENHKKKGFLKALEAAMPILSEEVKDRELTAAINRILREDGIEIDRIRAKDLIEVRLALKSRLKCRSCDPRECDGFRYRLSKVEGRIVGEWRACPVFLKKRILIPKIEEKLGEKLRYVLEQLGVSTLEELSIRSLRSILKEWDS